MKTIQKTKKKGGRRVKRSPRTRKIYIIIAALLAAAAIYILLASFLNLPGGIFSCSPKPKYVSDAGNISIFDPEYLEIQGNFRSYSDPNTGITSKQGIDVSYWQGDIDWEAVKAQGIEFTMIRLGYSGYKTGNIELDENFEQNISGAIAAGLDVGVYFYSQAINESEAENEAKFILRHIKNYDLSLPVVYDPEEYTADTARTDGLTGEQATKNCLAFCKVITDAGYQPMVYTNTYWAEEFLDMELLSDYPIWYACYNDAPTLTDGFAMWQYSCEGSLDGIESTYVDMDLLFIKNEE